ncbi:uncharacterized protein V6R79_012656 [Siganus canaliculatus]
MSATNNTTLPWSGSITTGTLPLSPAGRQAQVISTFLVLPPPYGVGLLHRGDGETAPVQHLKPGGIQSCWCLVELASGIRPPSWPWLSPAPQSGSACPEWSLHSASVWTTASTVVIAAGTNDLRKHQSEVLKLEYVAAIDHLLDC